MGRPGIVHCSSQRIVNALPTQGEVWWCDLPDVPRRPVVILSRNAAVRQLRRALVAPCTTRLRGLASAVVLEPATDPIPVTSAVSLDSIQNVAVGRLTERLGRLSHDRMREICEAVKVAIACL